MKPANYAPVYAGLYPELAEIARSKGYAMAVHGSMARDADLICIPWTRDAAEPRAVVDAILAEFVMKEVRGNPETKEHGRIVYTLTIAAPECFIDLSFMPRASNKPVEEGEKTARSWSSYEADNSGPSPFMQRINEEMGR